MMTCSFALDLSIEMIMIIKDMASIYRSSCRIEWKQGNLYIYIIWRVCDEMKVGPA